MLKPIDRQILRSWHELKIEPRLARLTGRKLRKTGPRIAVIGNCQCYGLAYAIKILRPEAAVDHYPVLLRARANMRILAQTLSTYDFVLSNDFQPGFVPGGGYPELRALLEKTMLVPQIVFNAFHPDCIYVSREDGSPVFSPLGPYHSALALFAFLKGLKVEEAHALFNENVFEALGYLDAWGPAAEETLRQCKAAGDLDLSKEFLKWSRRGVFMYTINHPKPFVLLDIARHLLTKLGLETEEFDSEHYMIDDFVEQIRPIYPVYPPIAARYGVLGSYLFRITKAHPARDTGDYLTLSQFLTGAYENYAKCRRSSLLCNPRVDAWLADPAVSEELAALARENLRAGRISTFVD
ncbi:MAG TPA: WcbI family polysaccharide biosynthesis putative acetyltransferase [Methylocystis sp.]|nr:WcbI family polysaccharide biosynthesis putative acetyltransferase [Methylocystis sp.]